MSEKRIVISGGSGLVGRALTEALLAAGYRVAWLTRSPQAVAGVECICWDVNSGQIPPESLAGAFAVVHLAGAPVAQRWTARARKEILNSRVQTARILTDAIEALPAADRPAAFLGGSAIGWYGESEAWQDETASVGEGFLSEVVEQWEAAEARAAASGVRTSIVRTGLVLSAGGGMLGKLLPLYRLGLGSPVGSGRQWQSWIHIDDLVRLFVHLIEDPELHGVFNGVAPSPVRQAELSRELARALHRPHILPKVPRWALWLVFGEMSQTICASQRIEPRATLEGGFKFQHPELQGALENLFV